MSKREIRLNFEVAIPEGASQAEEDRLIEEATEREIDKVQDQVVEQALRQLRF